MEMILILSACAGLTFSSRDSLLQWSNTEKWGLVLTFLLLPFVFCLSLKTADMGELMPFCLLFAYEKTFPD